MNGSDFEYTGPARDDDQPKPWSRQPGEPPDRYYWFRLYLSLPIPRKVAQVANHVGTNSERSWMSKIARQWRWKERAVDFDADHARKIVEQSELRQQLLLDKVFEAQFYGLTDTSKAIQNAEIDRMGRAEARNHLTQLSRHQRGLLRFVLQHNEGGANRALEELNQPHLAQLVEERARIMAMDIRKKENEIIMKGWGPYLDQE